MFNGAEMVKSEGAPERQKVRLLFGEALAAALYASGRTQEELAIHVDRRQSTVSNWASGKNEPDPWFVFEAEKFLGARPGSLSRFLGYVPIEAATIAGGVEEAINGDPRLPASQRAILIRSYHEYLDMGWRLRAGRRPKGNDPYGDKNPVAVERGRRGGQKGGRARAEKLTPEERSQIGKKAAAARWKKPN
jgi:transcriptional regulator with XRE-family HTH domain